MSKVYLLCFLLIIKLSVNSQSPPVVFDTSSTHTLVGFIGDVRLLNISEKGDTISVLDKSKVEIVISTIFGGKEKRIKTYVLDNKGNLSLIFNYNYLFKIEFLCKNYQTKYFILNTEKKDEWEEDFKFGFDFPFTITLINNEQDKKKKYKPIQVAMIKYRQETGYFNYK